MDIRDLLFPKKCVGCGKWGNYLCGDCFSQLKWLRSQICPGCGRQAVEGKTHWRCLRRWGMNGLVSLLVYEGVTRRMITALKFKFVADLAKEVVGKIVDGQEDWAEKFRGFTVTPVPLHAKRLKWRGFNQAEMIAKIVAKKWGLEFREILERVKQTGQQVGKTREERWGNIKGVFGLKAEDRLPGTILLIDDVWTSGATMQECAKVLKRAGVKEVWGLTLARRVWVD